MKVERERYKEIKLTGESTLCFSVPKKMLLDHYLSAICRRRGVVELYDEDPAGGRL